MEVPIFVEGRERDGRRKEIGSVSPLRIYLYVLIYTWVYVALPEQRMIKKRGFRHVSGLSAEDTPLA